MPRKNLVAIFGGIFLLTGCAGLRLPFAEKPAPAPAPTPPPRVLTAPAPQPTPRPTTRPVTQPTPRPTAPAAPAGISGNVIKEGNSFLVTRGSAAAPVPLFRQAIVLANVRAAVAGLPAPPKAEFQRGLLTLTFPRGTQPEIITAINRALTVPEVTRLRAIPPP